MTPFVIKVCGIKSADEIHSAAEAGATAIGFNFYHGSPRFLTVSRVRQLAQFVPGHLTKVGVFVSPTAHELTEAIEAASLDVIQIHGVFPADLPGGVRVWRAVPMTQNFNPATADPRAEAFLLDTPSELHGGSGRTFDWALAADHSPARLILAGGLEAANVAAAIRTVRPWGVDACSRLESAPGIKDSQKVKTFVEVARSAFLAYSPATHSAFVKETV